MVKATPTVANILLYRRYTKKLLPILSNSSPRYSRTEATTIPIDGGKISFKKLTSILDSFSLNYQSELNDELEAYGRICHALNNLVWDTLSTHLRT